MDHVRKVLKPTYHRARFGGELKYYISRHHNMDENHWMASHGCILVGGCKLLDYM